MRTIVRSVDVARPAAEVAARWARLEELPGILRSVVSVERVDDDRSRWVVRIKGEERAFGARVTESVPGVRLAWAAEGPTPHTGSVDFHRIDATHTRVTAQIDWEPRGLFDKVGDRLHLVARAVGADLERFRDAVESSVPVPAHDSDDTVTGTASVAITRGGEGRDAESPTDIPPKGWLQVLKRTVEQLKSDNVPVVAGGVAYFSFLALVPALAAVVSVYGLVADPSDVGRQLESFFGALPQDAADLLRTQLQNITDQQAGGLGVAVVIGILASLWSASKGMQAMISALNIAYDEEETRKGLRLRVITLGMTLALIVGASALVAGMIGLGAVASGLGTAGEVTLTVVRWPLLFGVLVLGLALLYRYAPDRDDPAWRWVTPGALVASALLVLGTFGFAFYVNNFGSYGETYGTLGAIVVLLLWLNLTAYVVVLGAELDAELERQTARDTTKGPEEPMGTRGAEAADTVAA
jgi:membrane protein